MVESELRSAPDVAGVSLGRDPDSFLLVVRRRGARETVTALLTRLGPDFEDLDEGSPDDDVYFVVRSGLDPEEQRKLMAEIEQELRQRDLDVVLGLKLVLEDGSFLGLTSELVVRFADHVPPDEVAAVAERYGLRVERRIEYAGNSYLLVLPGPPTYEVLEVITELQKNERVVAAEPNVFVHLVPDQFTPDDPQWAQLHHLRLIDCDDAWQALGAPAAGGGGSAGVTIAVVDTQGVTPNHPELATFENGSPKLVVDFDFLNGAAQTEANLGGDHGTQCAGSATAVFDNGQGIAGVAPGCRVIGARLPQTLTAVEAADVMVWCAGLPTGSSGMPAAPSPPADVLSCSWGEASTWATAGALAAPLPAALEALTSYSRRGRGCVVVFSSGNDGTDFTTTRLLAADTRTIAVGASGNAGPGLTPDTKLGYSNFGPQLDLVAPSSTGYSPIVDPIPSAVRVVVGSYATNFGGTSNSAPLVAGAAALVLSKRPTLTWQEVRSVLCSTAVQIVPADASWHLDSSGDQFSNFFGYGRLDVDAALAATPPSAPGDIVARDNLGDNGVVPSGGWHAESPDIWVRRANDPIPVLAYGAAPPHQSPRRGDPNHVYCRVKNIGAATRTATVRALIAHYPGFEFRYPNEFIPMPPPPTGGLVATGTFRIGELPVTLTAGSETIVKMPWPDALVPPATVVVNGVTVKWHPCLLLDVLPHDGPLTAAAALDIQRDNNIAQRNITILEPGEVGAPSMIVAGAGEGSIEGIVLSVVDAQLLRVRIHVLDRNLLIRLAKQLDTRLLEDKRFGDLPVVEVAVERKARTLPLKLRAGQFVPLLIALDPKTPRGSLRATQRRGNGLLSAGFEIRVASDGELGKIDEAEVVS